jgi:putative transposase
LELEIGTDYIHLFVEMPPKWAPAQIAYRVNGYTSHVLRREFPRLRSRLPSLWSRSYYVGTLVSFQPKSLGIMKIQVFSFFSEGTIDAFELQVPPVSQPTAERSARPYPGNPPPALQRREAWKCCRKSITYTNQANQLKELRKFDEDAA